MNCPYCLSEVSEEAYVCKVCTKDIYLFKPMMAKIAELESKLKIALEEKAASSEGQTIINNSATTVIPA